MILEYCETDNTSQVVLILTQMVYRGISGGLLKDKYIVNKESENKENNFAKRWQISL